jgi:hypothetical protein
MFGYIEENATPHSGRTDRADVNKRGALFGGKMVWLPDCNPLPNRRLENRKPSRFSMVLTARGDFEDANST